MRLFPLWLIAAAAFTACEQGTQTVEPPGGGPALSATPSTEITRSEDVSFTGPISTACVGEVVELHLLQQLLIHVTTDATGGDHFHASIADQGSYGIGLTSGTIYRFGGAGKNNSNTSITFPEGQSDIAFVNNVVLTGQGARIVYQEFFHLTFNAQGELVSVKIEDLKLKQCSAQSS